MLKKNLNQRQLNNEVCTDEHIVDLYFDRDEEAISCSDMKYGAYCAVIAKNITESVEDTQECVNDTWLKSWNTIPPTRPQFLRAFFARIVRNLALDRYRENHSQKRGGGETTAVFEELADCVSGKDNIEHEMIMKELGAAINRFLKKLSPKERNIFIRRYFFFEKSEEIALKYHLTSANVRKILSKTRLKLKNYLIEEGFDL